MKVCMLIRKVPVKFFQGTTQKPSVSEVCFAVGLIQEHTNRYRILVRTHRKAPQLNSTERHTISTAKHTSLTLGF